MARYRVKGYDAYGRPCEETIETSREDDAEWAALDPHPSFADMMRVLAKSLARKIGLPVSAVEFRR